jgi:hypothetical protein
MIQSQTFQNVPHTTHTTQTKKIAKMTQPTQVRNASNLLLQPIDEHSFLAIYGGQSVENLFTYLRFHAFPEESEQTVRTLIQTAFYVPCRAPEILKQIYKTVKQHDIQQCHRVLMKYKKPDTFYKALLQKAHVPISDVKSVDTILDAYFAEKDESLANLTLMALLNFEILPGNEEAFGEFVEMLSTMNREKKAHVLESFQYSSQMF